ncbi:hypothetical protein AM587_10000056 [Phytophthora nicotianae]|uniref:Uncharacterized protein n=1 Tax=Phytophthora nicotianae TaxID=4792 RepID=A0A0W8DGF5_PHYNI|nr:hypothetical protein AM587_10000056 [Phytophthora nicotianae]
MLGVTSFGMADFPILSLLEGGIPSFLSGPSRLLGQLRVRLSPLLAQKVSGVPNPEPMTQVFLESTAPCRPFLGCWSMPKTLGKRGNALQTAELHVGRDIVSWRAVDKTCCSQSTRI